MCFFFYFSLFEKLENLVQQTCWSELITYSSLVPLPPALRPQGVYLRSAGGNWKADGIPLVSEAEVRVSVWLRGLPLSGRGRRLSRHSPTPLPLSSAKQTSAAPARSHPPQNLSILSLRFRAGCLKWTELSPIWLTCSPSGSPMRAGHFTCFRLEKNHNRVTRSHACAHAHTHATQHWRRSCPVR